MHAYKFCEVYEPPVGWDISYFTKCFCGMAFLENETCAARMASLKLCGKTCAVVALLKKDLLTVATYVLNINVDISVSIGAYSDSIE